MTAARSPSEASGLLLPWRKRHPLLSRTLLYGLGCGLAVLILLLFTQRRDQDQAARLGALGAELDGMGLVLATDPTGTRVLELLDEKFPADAGLPVHLRGRALRWRAMAWRARASGAAAARDTPGRELAYERADAALEACRALDLEPAERTALKLEWAESRLERRDVAAGIELLPAPEELGTVPERLLRALLLAQARRLEGRQDQALALARTRVMDLEVPVDTKTKAYVGGREWTALEVAVELAAFATHVAQSPADGTLWTRLRLAAPQDYAVQAAAARGLEQLGLADDALTAWRAARRLDADLAAAAARLDPLLAQVEQRLARG